jgi:formylglycine-generating enzyme required for sulfatase activity
MKYRVGIWAGVLILASAVCHAGDKPPAKPTTEKVTIPKTTVEFTMVKIPAGKIVLKDKDGKEKEFEIKPIWMGKTEVTWDEYDVFCFGLDLSEAEQKRIRSQSSGVPGRDRPNIPYSRSSPEDVLSRRDIPYVALDRGWGHEGFPTGSVPIKWAKAYCEWLSKKTGKRYRLPTEAEWEYACRAAGAPRLEKAQLEKSAWFINNSDKRTHRVGEKMSNAWGLHDMLGNVAEWVIDIDGTESAAGGSYQDESADIQSAQREAYNKNWQMRDPSDPKNKDNYSDGTHVGFRIVRED